MVECKYRGRVIGWLVTGADGFLTYSAGEKRPPLPLVQVGPFEYLLEIRFTS